MKKQQFDPSVNLLEVRPQRQAAWEEGPDGRIVILIPKFSNRFLVQYFLPLLKSKYFRLQLDGYGSAFWNACDGATTVAGIIGAMQHAFPDQAATMSERVITFTRHLFREKFIRLETPTGSQ